MSMRRPLSGAAEPPTVNSTLDRAREVTVRSLAANGCPGTALGERSAEALSQRQTCRSTVEWRQHHREHGTAAVTFEQELALMLTHDPI